MKFSIVPVLALSIALAACGETGEGADIDMSASETAAPVVEESSLPAPDQELFTRVFAEACPDAEAVNTAVCKRAGLGSEDVICEYGLGDDEYLRNDATLSAGDDSWTLADPETVCAQ